jgi:primosomal replication protein N
VGDRLNVVISEEMLCRSPLKRGDEITVLGEVRSFNNKTGVGSRLVITVFSKEVRLEQAEDENKLALAGSLCKVPVYRKTPLGRDICDLMLAVNRRYGRTDYLPCIAWGTLARRCGELNVGDAIGLEGRLQSRTYSKHIGEEIQERTAFEISIMSMDLLGEPQYLRDLRETE